MADEVGAQAQVQVEVASDRDVVAARHAGREHGARAGFGSADQALIATAISELARNILQYAGKGTITLTLQDGPLRRGLVIVAEDRGPGIENVELAMQDGYSTSKGLGLGLPGVRRLTDEFEIHSVLGEGTRVVARKWVP
jgi:serine/threonine-protein kinase RsbT